MIKKLSKILGLLSVLTIITGCTAVATEVKEDNPAAVEDNGAATSEENESSLAEAPKVPIQLMAMKKDTVEHTYMAIGDVVPNNRVDIYVTGNGFIETLNAATGDYIEKDQLIIELDNNDKNYANYNATESQLRTVRDNLADQLTFLRTNYDNQLALFQAGIVPKNEIEQLGNQFPPLEREYENAKVAYSSQLTILRNNLEDGSENRRIYSPISGRVAAVNVKEGQAVTNQIGLTLIDDSGLFVRTYVTSDLKKILSVDDMVRVKLDGQEENVVESKITEIQDIPDPDTKLFEVLIEIISQDDYIIGDYAEVEFVIESYEAVLVPVQAVIRKGSDRYIYVYENDILKEVKIEAGRTSGEWIEVKNIDTLSDVVVRGQNQITSISDFVIIE